MSRRARLLASLAALAGLVLFAVSANIVFASLLRMSDTFRVPATSLANASAVQFAGFFLASIAGGLLADRIGKRLVLIAGSCLVAAGAGLWSLAPTLTTVFAGAAVMGMGGGVLEAMGTALMTDLFPSRRRLVLNLSQVAYCLGAVGGPAVMGWLLPLGVSWRLFFAGTAAAGVVIGVLFLAAGHAAGAPPERGTAGTAGPWPRLGASVWIPCLAMVCYVTAETGTATFLSLYLAEARGAPERWALMALALFWGMMMLGRLLCAWLPEEHPHAPVIAGLLGLGAIASAAHLAGFGWQAEIALFALTGLAFAGTWPLIVGLVAARHPRHTGTVVGLTAGIGSLGCIVAAPLLRPLMAGTRPAHAFALCALLLALAAAAILWSGATATAEKDTPP